MKESTLVINHLAAPSAPTNAHKKHIWFHMNKFTLMKNHWAVRFFQRNSVYFIAWRLMKKPFSCSKCDKQFTQVGHLQSHERIHTDEKPFGCSKCDKKFTQASHLKTHERVHANEKEEIHHIKCFEETWQNTYKGQNVKSHDESPKFGDNHTCWGVRNHSFTVHLLTL